MQSAERVTGDFEMKEEREQIGGNHLSRVIAFRVTEALYQRITGGQQRGVSSVIRQVVEKEFELQG